MPLLSHEKLILLCSRTYLDEDIKARIRTILTQGVEWPRLIDRAKQLEMTPLVYHNLKKIDSSLIPPTVFARLTHLYYQNLSRNLILSDELLTLTELFESQAIPLILIKGIILAEMVYQNLGLRQMCDLDVLIRREDVPRAVRLLTEHGFRVETRVPSQPSDFDRRRDVTLSKVIGQTRFPLELHWKFKDSFFRLPEEALWDHLTDYRWRGKAIKSFSPELTLIHLIHHLNYHAYPLKILVDVAETLRAYGQSLDWETVLRLVSEWRMVRNFLVALECVDAVLHPPVPEKVKQLSQELGGQRTWLRSVVRSEGWFFSPRALMIQSDGHLRAFFSALFLDGAYLNLLKALFRRAVVPGASVGSHRSLSGLVRFGLRLLRHILGLVSGLFKVLIPHRKRSSPERV